MECAASLGACKVPFVKESGRIGGQGQPQAWAAHGDFQCAMQASVAWTLIFWPGVCPGGRRVACKVRMVSLRPVLSQVQQLGLRVGVQGLSEASKDQAWAGASLAAVQQVCAGSRAREGGWCALGCRSQPS